MTSTRMRAFGVGAVALSGISLTAGFASSAVAASGCGAGATLVSPEICEITFTSGSHTFTPPAGITKLDALVVGGGSRGYSASASSNEYHSYGGNGGDVKVVSLSVTGDVNVVVGAGSTSTVAASASSATQGSAVTTSNPGENAQRWNTGRSGAGTRNGNDYGGSGNTGVILYFYVSGGSGASAYAGGPDNGNGGAGIVASSIATGTLFSSDTDCFGGGGGGSVWDLDWRPATIYPALGQCGGGSVTVTAAGSAPFNASQTLAAPRANSGGGGAAYWFAPAGTVSSPGTVQSGLQDGAAGVVILRFDATQTPVPLPDTGMNVGGTLGLGASALIAGAAALILGRRRKA
jgi:LPXTG-motif cell wall-anchored protein